MTTPLVPETPKVHSLRALLLFVVGLSVGVVISVTTLTYFSVFVAKALLDCVPNREAPPATKPKPKEQRL